MNYYGNWYVILEIRCVMSKTNITKFVRFVILSGGLTLQAACGVISPGQQANVSNAAELAKFEPPTVVGRLESDEITESSGLAASKCQTDVFWTHNDSGDGPFIYAINEKGESLGTWKVAGATNKDWEGIAERKESDGRCYLYIGEIGNNEFERDEMKVYRVAEPSVSEETVGSSKKQPLVTEESVAVKFKYPEAPRNAETLLVHPVTGDIYVLTKSKSDPSEVFKIKPEFGDAVQTAHKVAEITVPAVPNGLLTGGDISGDGKHVLLCDYFAGYELTLAEGRKSFDDIWSGKPLRLDIGKRQVGEAVAYAVDGNSVFATSEKRGSPIFRSVRSTK